MSRPPSVKCHTTDFYVGNTQAGSVSIPVPAEAVVGNLVVISIDGQAVSTISSDSRLTVSGKDAAWFIKEGQSRANFSFTISTAYQSSWRYSVVVYEGDFLSTSVPYIASTAGFSAQGMPSKYSDWSPSFSFTQTPSITQVNYDKSYLVSFVKRVEWYANNNDYKFNLGETPYPGTTGSVSLNDVSAIDTLYTISQYETIQPNSTYTTLRYINGMLVYQEPFERTTVHGHSVSVGGFFPHDTCDTGAIYDRGGAAIYLYGYPGDIPVPSVFAQTRNAFGTLFTSTKDHLFIRRGLGTAEEAFSPLFATPHSLLCTPSGLLIATAADGTRKVSENNGLDWTVVG
jgi:hypothetical protein